MLVAGITGGIGSGKTTVCKIFETLSIPVFYSDLESKKILVTAAVVEEIVGRLGVSVLTDNELDKGKLSKIVFNDKKELEWLNSLLHPKVRAAFDDWTNQQTSPYILKEAAILFESGANNQCDFVINVSCPEEERISRVVKRDGASEDKVKSIITKQLSEEERQNLSDFNISNFNSKLIPQVSKIHLDLMSKSK